MAAHRVRRVFVQPFVITLSVLPACGGAKAPPPEPIAVAAAPDAAPAPTGSPEPTPGATPSADPTPIAAAPDGPDVGPINRNPPPPQPIATRDLRWKLVRTAPGQGANCTAQQIEPCQRAKKPCKPPVEKVLCVYESSSTPEAELKKYPLEVEQKQGSAACFIVGSKPAEQTYCPTEWKVTK